MATLQRHFWGWDAPVLENAVRYLSQLHMGETALELSDTLIIVPTSEAGRRLKESLARAVPAGVLVPWVWTAEQALLSGVSRKTLSTPLQSQMAWQQAVRRMDISSLTALFPRLPDERDWRWEVELAKLLFDLHSLLGSGGMGFADVTQQIGQDVSRWGELELIARAYAEELESAGLLDSQVAKLEGARVPHLPEGVLRVVVLAAPDLPPLFHRWLNQCPSEVVIAVQAPAELADSFDEMGRPLPTRWGDKVDLVLPVEDTQIHLCHDAGAQAEKVTALLRDLAPQTKVAVGVGDPEVGAVLQERLALENVRVFEPGGVAPQQTGLWHVLQLTSRLVEGRSWTAFTALLRVAEVRIAWLADRKSGLNLLRVADDFGMEHMPVTLDHALELLGTNSAEKKELRTALIAARATVQDFRQEALLKAARRWLIQLYGERPFTPDAPKDQLIASLGDAWLDCCRQVSEEAARFSLEPTPQEALALSLEALAKTALSETRGEVDLVLQGWLELLWEPSPGLIVAGVNEEFVPGILIAHPFLPDQTREQLGLPCQTSRFARDAYTLRALAEQRLLQKTLHLLCGQWSDRGESLRPSRLLFLCEDARLPQRVNQLFPKDEAAETSAQEPARTVAWQLKPRLEFPAVETISPSRIRSYLECPFRDYLSYGLGMEAVDATKRELNPAEFGTLIHHAFQKLVEDTRMSDCVKAEEIADYLIDAAIQQAHQLYGRRPAPLIGLQLESLKQRLRHAAETEAAERESGWVIYKAEWEPGAEIPLLIEGARLRCKVDRVERNVRNGHIRVLDFKTSDKMLDPQSAHVRKLSSRSRIVEADLWKCFDLSDGKSYQWKDLQLPLYAAALRLHGLSPQEVGYFTLPKSVQDTKVLTWEGFSDEWVDRALDCAAEIVKRMRAGLFWPPAEKAWDRGFDEIFLGDLAASVTWPSVAE